MHPEAALSCRIPRCLGDALPRIMRCLVWVGALVLMASTASALDFRSVADVPAILYAGPSVKTEKLYAVSAASPVEVISAIEGWVKVRTVGGEIAWAEAGSLVTRRMVAVVAPVATVRTGPGDTTPGTVAVKKGVVLEFIEIAGPWVKVRHRDGLQGYLKTSEVWGL